MAYTTVSTLDLLNISLSPLYTCRRTSVFWSSRYVTYRHKERIKAYYLAEKFPLTRKKRPLWETCTKVSNYKNMLLEKSEKKDNGLGKGDTQWKKVEVACLRQGRVIASRVNNTAMSMAIQDTHLQNLSPLLVGYNLFLVCRDWELPFMMNVAKSVPQMVLLGGYVYGQLLTAKDIFALSVITSKDEAYSVLLNTLDKAVSAPAFLLNSQQTELVTTLAQLAEQLDDPAGRPS